MSCDGETTKAEASRSFLNLSLLKGYNFPCDLPQMEYRLGRKQFYDLMKQEPWTSDIAEDSVGAKGNSVHGDR